jgi:hypothetical protein
MWFWSSLRYHPTTLRWFQMSKNNGSQNPPSTDTNPLRTGGYQPQQEGYTGIGQKGYVGSDVNVPRPVELPKPPVGGSGVTQLSDQGSQKPSE